MRRVSGVDMADLIWNNREDTWDVPELGGLRGGEADGEAVDDGVVGVEDLGGVRGRGKGLDDGGVPMVVGREKLGLC